MLISFILRSKIPKYYGGYSAYHVNTELCTEYWTSYKIAAQPYKHETTNY
jgi:hypothetical protein